VLDCYDSQVHDDQVEVEGATNTDETHRRDIRSSPSCATPFIGKKTTGAIFESTKTALNNGVVFTLTETHARIISFPVKLTINSGANTILVNLAGASTKAIFIIAHDSTNAGDGSVGGIRVAGTDSLAFGCIVYNLDGTANGIHINNTSGTAGAVCCTVNDIPTPIGISFTFDPAADAVSWSCYSANCNGDFKDSTYWDYSKWNSSKDTTSDFDGDAGDDYKNSNDLITGGELDTDYLATEPISWAGGAGDNAGRSPINDLSGVWDPDNFFTTDPLSTKDIAGNDRPAGDDEPWDVGASQFVADTAAIRGWFRLGLGQRCK